MNVTAEKYVEIVGALSANTPETPYEIVMDEFTSNISAKIKQAGRYVNVTFLGYGPVDGASINYDWSYIKDGEEHKLSLKPVGVLEIQSDPKVTYYVDNTPDKMILNGDYYSIVNGEYVYISNPENLDSYTSVELLNTNYPKYEDNPFIVGLTYYTMNTTSDYRNMFKNCENLRYVLFWGECFPRYGTLQKANMVKNCPNLKAIGIADSNMNEILDNQMMENLEVLLTAYNAHDFPANASSDKIGLRPFTTVNVAGRINDCYIDTKIAEYPLFVGNVNGSTEENPVSVVISDPENLKHGIVITD